MDELISLLEHPKVVSVKLWKRRPDNGRVDVEVELISGKLLVTHNDVQFLVNQLKRVKGEIK